MVSGNHVFVAQSNGLVIVNVTNGSNPVKEGECDGIQGYWVTVKNDHVYLGGRHNGLKILDVSLKKDPKLVGELPDVWGGATVVAGDYAYVCSSYRGLSIVDISDKANPRESGSYYSAASLEDVYVAGDYAYLANGCNGFVILDICTKTNPQRIGACETPGTAYEVVVEGDYAYIADGKECLSIIDVSDKTDPQIVGTNDWGGESRGLAVVGDYIYVAAGKNGLFIVDVSDKTDPQLIGDYNSWGVAHGVAIDGNYAYLADGDYGLAVIDISDKTDPQEVGKYDTNYEAVGVEVVNDHAYLAVNNDGLVIVDVTDKTAPTRASKLNTAGYTKDVTVLGEYAYLADWRRGLVVGDVHDVSNPNTLRAGGINSHEAHGVTAAGEYVYLADGVNGLLIFELAPVARIDRISPNPALDTDTISFEGLGNCKYDRSIEEYVWTSSMDGELYSSSEHSNFNIDTLSIGTHIISLQVLDSEGLWSETLTRTLTVHEKPVANITSISPNPALNNEVVHFSGSDTDDGTIECYVWSLSLDDELYNGTNSSFSLSNLSVGTHTIYLKVQDNYGVWSEEVNTTLTINEYIPPNQKPTVTITSPENGSKVKGNITINGSASDEDGTIDKVEISINGGEWIAVTGTDSWSYEWGTTKIKNGEYIIRIRSYDGTNYSEEQSVNIKVENKEDGGDGGFIPGFVAVALIGIVVMGLLLLYSLVHRAKKRF